MKLYQQSSDFALESFEVWGSMCLWEYFPWLLESQQGKRFAWLWKGNSWGSGPAGLLCKNSLSGKEHSNWSFPCKELWAHFSAFSMLPSRTAWERALYSWISWGGSYVWYSPKKGLEGFLFLKGFLVPSSLPKGSKFHKKFKVQRDSSCAKVNT